MSIHVEFLASYSMLSQSPVTPTCWPGCLQTLCSVSVLQGAHANYSYFDTCRRLCASVASACNWAGYGTFNVMVLKWTHYTTRITLNVLQTGCILVF